MQTPKVQVLAQTVRDTLQLVADLQREAKPDRLLLDRARSQLASARYATKNKEKNKAEDKGNN